MLCNKSDQMPSSSWSPSRLRRWLWICEAGLVKTGGWVAPPEVPMQGRVGPENLHAAGMGSHFPNQLSLSFPYCFLFIHTDTYPSMSSVFPFHSHSFDFCFLILGGSIEESCFVPLQDGLCYLCFFSDALVFKYLLNSWFPFLQIL